MKSLLSIISKKILSPIAAFQKKYISLDRGSKVCHKIANFIFKRSKDTAFILLVLNAISTITSHLAQIGGLKKNKRDNSDYLINQEWQELGLDIALTIVPPFILNNFLMKKLDSGEWTTRSARNIYVNDVAPTVGASRCDLYSTQHIVSLKETLGGYVAAIINKLRKNTNLPKKVEKILNKIESNRYISLPDPNKQIPLAAMENVTTDFDMIREKKYKGFYNGSAYDEISGQRNGILIMAAIAYTVLASAIITPIIKNKLANRSYKKHLEKQKLKQSLNPVQYKTFIERNDNDVFEGFSQVDNTIKINPDIKKETPPKQNTFNNFNTFSGIISQSSGLRI